MGAGSSTRKITLINDEKSGVIKLSESLAHRLRGQLETEKVSQKENISPSSNQQPNGQSEKPSCEQLAQNKSDIINMSAWTGYSKDAHYMISKLREEKELELQHKDAEWRAKIKDKEKEYVQLSNLTEEHLIRTAKEVESLFMRVSCDPVCQEKQQRVAQCYQDNRKMALRCSDQVQSFMQCVDLHRLQNITGKMAS